MSKTIGVLGGIGPGSSAFFYEQLVSKFKEKYKPKQNIDYPRIIINSIPAPELTSGENQSKWQFYVDGLSFLETESDFIVIVCNTAHAFYDDFAKIISKPILDLRALVHKTLKQKNVSKMLILASPNSMEANIFAYPAIQVIDLDGKTKALLGEIIGRINLGTDSLEDKTFVFNLIERFQEEVDTVLIACTELSILLKDVSHPKKVDTLEVLLDSTLQYYAALS